MFDNPEIRCSKRLLLLIIGSPPTRSRIKIMKQRLAAGLRVRFAVIAILSLFCAQEGLARGFMERFRRYIVGDIPARVDTRPGFVLDLATQQCMTCHNGTHAQKIELKSAEASMQYMGHKNVNHPVGMSYSYYAHKSPREYIPEEQLDPNITIADGRVVCLSCHKPKSAPMDPYGAQRVASAADEQVCMSSDELTVTIDMSRLCLSCHIK